MKVLVRNLKVDVCNRFLSHDTLITSNIMKLKRWLSDVNYFTNND
jgi:hypothetical protein